MKLTTMKPGRSIARLRRYFQLFKAKHWMIFIGVFPALFLKHNTTPVVKPQSYVSPTPLALSHYDFSKTPAWYKKTNLEGSQSLSINELGKALTAGVPSSLRPLAKAYVNQVMYFSNMYNIDPLLVMAVMWTESHFISKAKSHMHARGLMQIMPGTGKYLMGRLNRPVIRGRSFKSYIYDPDVNIELGVYYLKDLITRFKSTRLAIVAYNMGPAAVTRRLRSNRPVGVKNQYLNKVRRSYLNLSKSFNRYIILKNRVTNL